MLRLLPHAPPRAALAVAALGAGMLFLGTTPAGAQQNVPTLRPSVPLVNPTKRFTPVDLDFTIPPGVQLVDLPRLRMLNPKGVQVVLLSMHVDRRGPTGKGSQRLNTEDFPPGKYQIRFEIDYADAQGKKGTLATPWAPFVVPKR
jgi:hypothetical protein